MLKLCGFFVESSNLEKEFDLVTNENLCINSNYNLQEILANYRVKHHFNIKKELLKDLKQLTEIENIFIFELNKLKSIEKKILSVDFKIINNGNLTAFFYWFETNNNNNTMVNTYACIRFLTSKQVNILNGTIQTCCIFENDFFHMKIKKD